MGYTETPTANSLAVNDFNDDIPTEAPPSYSDALADPQFNEASNQPQQQFQRPPQRPPQAPPMRPPQSQQQYQRPSQPPPPSRPAQSQYSNPQQPQLRLRPATVINPNPYLPWQYPDTVKQCRKCANTGFETKKGKPCKRCWKDYRRGVTPPLTQAELERLVKNPPPPKRINPNVTQLPPGVAMLPPIMGPGQNGPTVVRPGDPRIGGVLCPRCNGKGMVHFFLDKETCSVCRGMGRVNNNGRPI